MIKPCVITFSGSIASGKSTLSRSLATELRWKHASFGDYIRSQAKLYGLEASRRVLQNLGQSLIGKGWEQFCRLVLDQSDWTPGEPIIIDGIRHIEVITTLRSLVSPLEVILIFISVDEETRKTRIQLRDCSEEESEQSVQNHPTEVQVNTRLQQVANLTVYGDQPPTQIIYEIMIWLHQFE